jgi:hypothetical protein
LRVVRAWGLAVAIVACVVPSAGLAERSSAPVTLVQTEHWIYAFAQDGPRLAWVGSVPGPSVSTGDAAVFVRLAGGRASIRLTPHPQGADRFGLALGGGRALWWSQYSGINTYTRIGTAAVSDRRAAILQRELNQGPCGEGRSTGGVAADGGVLVYSVVEYAFDENVPDPRATCSLRSAGGHTSRVVGRRTRRIGGVGGAIHIAVAGSTLAAVDYSGAVTIRDALTGRPQASFRPEAPPLAVALSSAYAAVLVRSTARSSIELYDARTGELRRSVAVPRQAGASRLDRPALRTLSASPVAVVYSVGRNMYALNAQTYRIRWLGRAGGPPIGLSIEGDRIAWAENVRGHGRIRALTLPRT